MLFLLFEIRYFPVFLPVHVVFNNIYADHFPVYVVITLVILVFYDFFFFKNDTSIPFLGKGIL
jgi:hypothetical protein